MQGQQQQRRGKHQLHQTSVSFKDVIEKKVMQGGREGGREGCLCIASIYVVFISTIITIRIITFLHSEVSSNSKQ